SGGSKAQNPGAIAPGFLHLGSPRRRCTLRMVGILDGPCRQGLRPCDACSPSCELDSLIGARPFRRTGISFAGTRARAVKTMTWRIPTDVFLQIHVILSLVGIAAGLVALYGLLAGKLLRGWTALFLATTVLTSVTGFPLPPFGFDPPRAVGVLSLLLLALALAALYVFQVRGAGSKV